MTDFERHDSTRGRARGGQADTFTRPRSAGIPGKDSGTAGLAEGRNGPYTEPTLGPGGPRGQLYAGPDGDAQRGATNVRGETRDVGHADGDGGARYDVASKYTYRRKTEFQIHIGPIPAKVQARWEFSLKDKGTARHGIPGLKGKTSNVSWGSNQALVERSAEGLKARISTTLVSASFDLLADGKLPGPLGVLVPKVEVRGLDAALSTKGPELKAMSLSLVLDDEFTQFLDESVRSVLEVRGQVRIECAIDAELAKRIIEMSRAANDVARAVAVEGKIAKTEKQISYWTAIRRRDKVAKLEKELAGLRKIRGGVAKAKDVALRHLDDIGRALEKTAGGRLVKKLGSKALSLVFKKFIPIFNVISTAQDIYEVVDYLRGIDWGKIGDRIANPGGGGGTGPGDGSDDSENAGDRVGPDGPNTSGSGDGIDVDAEAIAAELEREQNVELSAAAQAVVSVVEARSNDGHVHHPLSKEDKETLNHVVPDDLLPEEIEAIKARISTAGSSPQDLIASVITAIQQVRPFGEKRLGPAKNAADEADGRAPVASAAAKNAPGQAKPKAKPARTGTWIVDPIETLQRVIKVDEHGEVIVPTEVQFPGFAAYVRSTGSARLSFGTTEPGTETSYLVRVEIRVAGAPPPGVFVRLGRDVRELDTNPIRNITVVVVSGAPGV